MKRLGMQPVDGASAPPQDGSRPPAGQPPANAWEKRADKPAKPKGWSPPTAEEKKISLLPGQLESMGCEIPVRSQLVGGTFPGAMVISNQAELERAVQK
eukprot:1915674-Amphidinium_carterae.1